MSGAGKAAAKAPGIMEAREMASLDLLDVEEQRVCTLVYNVWNDQH